MKKEEWEIKDFRKWDLENEFSFEEAAYLFHEVNPQWGSPGYPIPEEVLREIKETYKDLPIPEDILSKLKETYKEFILPEDVLSKINETYKDLIRAAKTEVLYRPRDLSKEKPRRFSGHPPDGNIQRDDLKYFFGEGCGKKPKFLFPEERGKQTDQSDPLFNYTPDYRCVNFKGKQIDFTSRQAQIIEILHTQHKSGVPDVGKDYILEKIGSETSRLRDAFQETKCKKKVMHEAWGTLIIQGGKRGTYRLNL